MTLDELPRETPGTVTALEARGTERRRLMDLGLLPGVEVHVDITSPLGDPTAYRVRGSSLVLRRSQARGVHVDTGASAKGGGGLSPESGAATGAR